MNIRLALADSFIKSWFPVITIRRVCRYSIRSASETVRKGDERFMEMQLYEQLREMIRMARSLDTLVFYLVTLLFAACMFLLLGRKSQHGEEKKNG